jgi:hypothetical protein
MKIENIDPPDQNRFDKILDRRAKKNMFQWDLKQFKKVFPRLYKTIIESMNESSKNQ